VGLLELIVSSEGLQLESEDSLLTVTVSLGLEVNNVIVILWTRFRSDSDNRMSAGSSRVFSRQLQNDLAE
jgi:hypothetical protein